MAKAISYGKNIADFDPRPMPNRDGNSPSIDMNFSGINAVVRTHSERLAALSYSLNIVSAASGSSVSPANPSASIGLAAVNGSASTYMRSDAAPALSQAITPTWSALHTFTLAPKVSAFAGGGALMVVTDNVGQLGTQAIPTGATGANPTGTIGLSAVNGAAATFLRSDGAPALSQAIVPTWTGAHTFSTGIYPSYAVKGAVTYLTRDQYHGLVPFASGAPWTSTLVTFSPTSILQTSSGAALHSAYLTYTTGFNSAGKGFYGKYKFKYVNSSQTPLFGVNSSPTSLFPNMGSMKFTGANTLGIGQVGGGTVTTGFPSFTFVAGTTYTMYVTYLMTDATHHTTSFRLFDSAGTTLLNSGTVENISGSYAGTFYLGLFCQEDTGTGELLDIVTYGLDTDTGGGLLYSNSTFVYDERTQCVGIGTASPTFGLDVNNSLRVTGSISLPNQTASRALFTSSTSGVTTNAIIGTGNVVMSISPTLTGTISAAAANFSGTVALSGILKFSSATFSNANATISAGTTYLAQIGTMSASRTVTLPAASAYARGAIIIIADESGTCTVANSLVITRAGSDTINGATTKTVGVVGGYDVCILMSDGTSKWTVLSSI